MEVLILGAVGAALSYAILYFVVKAAVRDGILEAKRAGKPPNEIAHDGTRISQVICPACGAEHDMDYPKCPHCKHPTP